MGNILGFKFSWLEIQLDRSELRRSNRLCLLRNATQGGQVGRKYMYNLHVCHKAKSYVYTLHATDPMIISVFLHIQFDVRVNSSPTQKDNTAKAKANEFIAAKHEREFSLFNIASVCATDSKVKVSSERMLRTQWTGHHWYKSWPLNWNFVSLFLGFGVSHRFSNAILVQ